MNKPISADEFEKMEATFKRLTEISIRLANGGKFRQSVPIQPTDDDWTLITAAEYGKRLLEALLDCYAG